MIESIKVGVAYLWSRAILRVFFLLLIAMNFLVLGPLVAGALFTALGRNSPLLWGAVLVAAALLVGWRLPRPLAAGNTAGATTQIVTFDCEAMTPRLEVTDGAMVVQNEWGWFSTTADRTDRVDDLGPIRLVTAVRS